MMKLPYVQSGRAFLAHSVWCAQTCIQAMAIEHAGAHAEVALTLQCVVERPCSGPPEWLPVDLVLSVI